MSLNTFEVKRVYPGLLPWQRRMSEKVLHALCRSLSWNANFGGTKFKILYIAETVMVSLFSPQAYRRRWFLSNQDRSMFFRYMAKHVRITVDIMCTICSARQPFLSWYTLRHIFKKLAYLTHYYQQTTTKVKVCCVQEVGRVALNTPFFTHIQKIPLTTTGAN